MPNRIAAIVSAFALIAFALSAVGCEYDRGVSAFKAADDGTVLAIIARGGAGAGLAIAGAASPAPPDGDYQYGYAEYKSADGGLTWSPNPDRERTDDIQPTQSAETPRGAYSIGDFGVERTDAGGLRETVYSTEHLRGDANRWLQNNATSALGGRILAARPSAVVYHVDSGNVIVGVGIQGAAVETPDGRWRRVGVGPYVPTDFSLPVKRRALLERGWFVGAIAAALSLFSLTLAAAASAYEHDGKNRGVAVHLGFIIAIPIASLTVAALDGSPGGSLYMLTALAGVAMSWIMVLIASTFERGNLDRRKFALIGCAWPLPIVMELLFPFDFGLFNYGGYGDIVVLAVIIAAFIALIPPLALQARIMARRWTAFAAAFLVMNALVALAFAAWIHLNLNLLAAQVAIAALAGLTAAVLGWRVGRAAKES